MAIPPESIEVGRYYLSTDGRVRRVVKFLPDGRVRYAYRSVSLDERRGWKTGRLDVGRFAETTLREAPRDLTSEPE